MPHSAELQGGLSSLAEKFGLNSATIRNMGNRVRNMNGRDVLDRGREFAKSRPAIALGGLAVAAIAAGLLRGRSSR